MGGKSAIGLPLAAEVGNQTTADRLPPAAEVSSQSTANRLLPAIEAEIVGYT